VTPPYCPTSNGTTFTTPGSNVAYDIYCGADTEGALYADSTGTYSNQFRTTCGYQECFEACNVRKGCLGYTWLGLTGAMYGMGVGDCYFKQQARDCAPISYNGSVQLNDTKVSAIKVNQAIVLTGCAVTTTTSLFSTTYTPTPSPVRDESVWRMRQMLMNIRLHRRRRH
jgi:hypothetical protein